MSWGWRVTDATTTEKPKPPPAERLVKGAAVLGTLFRKKIVCASGWRYVACSCEPKTEFCKARALWIDLLTKEIVAGGRDPGLVGDAGEGVVRVDDDHEFALVLMMTSAEFEASGLTLHLDFPEIGVVKVGPKGTLAWKAFRDKTKNASDLKLVMKVLRDFPGAKVVE
jgi:hypothetical protein